MENQMRIIALGVVALTIVSARGSAQSALQSGAPIVAAPIASHETIDRQKGPTIELAAIGVKAARANAALPSRARPAKHSGISHGAALMVVGGGAMVAGTFMDGDPHTIFIVGGALVALYGLYLLMQ
jgi:hypothetical protein